MTNKLFMKITKAISKYIACKYTGASEFCTGLVDLTLPMLMAPPPPDLVNMVLMELWKMDLKEHQKKLEDYQCNMAKVYAIILDQCSPTICDHIEASTEWEVMNMASDVLHLSGIIHQSFYQ